MKKRIDFSKLILVLVVVCVLLSVFAACGTNDAPNGGNQTPSGGNNQPNNGPLTAQCLLNQLHAKHQQRPCDADDFRLHSQIQRTGLHRKQIHELLDEQLFVPGTRKHR